MTFHTSCSGRTRLTVGASMLALLQCVVGTNGVYSGLRTPYATSATHPGAAPTGVYAAAPAAAAAVKPSGLSTPWATNVTTTAAAVQRYAAPPAAAPVLAVPQGNQGGICSLTKSSSSRGGSTFNSNNSSTMAALLGGDAEQWGAQQKQQLQRPGTAAAGLGERKYPWEWPGA